MKKYAKFTIIFIICSKSISYTDLKSKESCKSVVNLASLACNINVTPANAQKKNKKVAGKSHEKNSG